MFALLDELGARAIDVSAELTELLPRLQDRPESYGRSATRAAAHRGPVARPPRISPRRGRSPGRRDRMSLRPTSTG